MQLPVEKEGFVSVDIFTNNLFPLKFNFQTIDHQAVVIPAKNAAIDPHFQGSPWPKWTGGGGPDQMAPPVVRGEGGPKLQNI